MAANGFTPVYLYASGTAGHIPLAANLTNTTNGSEIALNYSDGNLFFKNASNSVITTPLLQSSGSQSGWLSSTDWTTFNSKQAALVSGTNIKTVNGTSLLGSGDVGTIDVSHGGTGLTSLTANYVPFGNGTLAFSSSSNFKYDSTSLLIASASVDGNWKIQTNATSTGLTGIGVNNDGGYGVYLIYDNSARYGGGAAIRNIANTPLYFETNNTNQANLGTNGDFTLTYGSIILSATGKGIIFGSNVIWQVGSGSPEGVVTAPVGSLYTNTSGGAGTTLYVKQSGTGNTGWAAK